MRGVGVGDLISDVVVQRRCWSVLVAREPCHFSHEDKRNIKIEDRTISNGCYVLGLGHLG